MGAQEGMMLGNQLSMIAIGPFLSSPPRPLDEKFVQPFGNDKYIIYMLKRSGGQEI
jgi:hypothetical protein